MFARDRKQEMAHLILTTFDWLPEFPRGYVRDIRIRWALEEAGLPYSVEGVPFKERDADHFKHQPFGQVPWLTDGDVTIFESGAAVLHIAEKSDVLLPSDAKGRSEVIKWLFAALNSVEAASLPWFIFQFTGNGEESDGREAINDFLSSRLSHMEDVLESKDWLTDRFSAADIVMVDVFRVIDRFDGLSNYPVCRNYMKRAEDRPAFKKALADQIGHFKQADLREAVMDSN
ncbi:glutathione S-transferase family protein [uncultured Ruegeria sp.]|uniref:glutathione S-transferase family protein n=1 Tax=uncultured Ruegeria sp. TaxID=259304 RepID=UPI00260700F5|nr:glutathione S-transferase family protein [uncultured Ruegeria sp.]